MEKFLGEFLAFNVSLVKGIGAQFSALDFMLKLLVIALFCLVMLALLVSARRGATSGERALRRDYAKLAKSGVADWELPLRLMSEREEWNLLPKEFLMEMAAHLVERDKVIDFILLVENDDFDRETFARLTNYETEAAMQELAVLLTDHAGELEPRETIKVLELAVLIDPENHLAMAELATEHYNANHYGKALPLIEQAMHLNQQVTPVDADIQRPGAKALDAESLEDIRTLLGQMYEDCVERVGAKAA